MYSASANVSSGVISAVREAIVSDTAFAGCVDKTYRAVGMHFGHYAHMAYSAAFARAAEEKEVARLEVCLLDFHALTVLVATAGAEFQAEMAEYIVCETGAVKSLGTFRTASVRTPEKILGEIHNFAAPRHTFHIADGISHHQVGQCVGMCSGGNR